MNVYKPLVPVATISCFFSVLAVNTEYNCFSIMRPSLILSLTVAAVAQAAVVPREAAASGLKWLGVSESVAEFGTALPGTWGVDFYFPSTTTIDVHCPNSFHYCS